MGAHNDTANDYQLFNMGAQTIADPGSGGTFNLRGIDRGIATIASGSRKLPDNTPLGVTLKIYATGNVTITNVSGTTVASLVADDIGTFTAKTATTWVATVSKVGATGGTAAGISIADAGSYTGKTDAETVTQLLLARSKPKVNTAITTVGDGSLTAAGIIGGLITRSGSTAAYTDTTVDASAIFAALGTVITGTDGASWILAIKNTVAFPETIVGGTDVTITGQSVVPPNSTGLFLVATNGADQIDMVGFGSARQTNLKRTQFSTSATTTSLTAAANILTGAEHVYWQNTADGAVALTTRTGAQMFADISNCHIGLSFQLTIVNRGDNTVTLTAAASGVTISGEATVATTTTRTYHVECTAANTFVFTSANKGTIET